MCIILCDDVPFPLCLDRGAGGSGATRRIPPDVPPHIQQLLEQQERQALERGSPMRRPICRRVLASGGTEYTDSPGNVYIVPGVLNKVYNIVHVFAGADPRMVKMGG